MRPQSADGRGRAQGPDDGLAALVAAVERAELRHQRDLLAQLTSLAPEEHEESAAGAAAVTERSQ